MAKQKKILAKKMPRVVFNGVGMGIMLAPGLLVDSAYWGRLNWPWLDILLDVLRGMKKWGITYHSAFEFLKDNVGVLITIVSLFFTISISISERGEMKAYGITRRELEDNQKGLISQWIRWMSYLAPILMIGCLNLFYCVTGYLIFAYSYLSLIDYLYYYVSRYSRSRTRNVIVQKILLGLPEFEAWTREEQIQHEMLLSRIGRAAEEEGDWNDIEMVFCQLREEMKNFKDEKKLKVVLNFYRIVYWRDDEICRDASVQLLRSVMSELDHKLGESDNSLCALDSVAWGMVVVALQQAKGEELEEFFKWFLCSADRSAAIYRCEGREVATEIFEKQYGMMTVLIEMRLRSKWLISENCKQQIIEIWNLGKNIFLKEDGKCGADICHLCKLLHKVENKPLENIVKELEKDYRYGEKHCLITVIATM